MSAVCLCGLPAGQSPNLLPNYCNLSSKCSGVTEDVPKARECDLAFPLKVTVRSRVDALDKYLLIEQRVIGSQCACSIVVALVVMAQVSLSQRWNVLVDINLVA